MSRKSARLAGCFHIPGRGESASGGVRYYGYCSNVSRGKRKETKEDGVPCILEADKGSKEYRKNWARLIQKIVKGGDVGSKATFPVVDWKKRKNWSSRKRGVW